MTGLEDCAWNGVVRGRASPKHRAPRPDQFGASGSGTKRRLSIQSLRADRCLPPASGLAPFPLLVADLGRGALVFRRLP
jgi:hypothetical protein